MPAQDLFVRPPGVQPDLQQHARVIAPGLDLCLRGARRVQHRAGLQETVEEHGLRRAGGLLDLPVIDAGAGDEMLLSREADDGDAGPGEQVLRELPLLILHQRHPLPVARDDV